MSCSTIIASMVEVFRWSHYLNLVVLLLIIPELETFCISCTVSLIVHSVIFRHKATQWWNLNCVLAAYIQHYQSREQETIEVTAPHTMRELDLKCHKWLVDILCLCYNSYIYSYIVLYILSCIVLCVCNSTVCSYVFACDCMLLLQYRRMAFAEYCELNHKSSSSSSSSPRLNISSHSCKLF